MPMQICCLLHSCHQYIISYGNRVFKYSYWHLIYMYFLRMRILCLVQPCQQYIIFIKKIYILHIHIVRYSKCNFCKCGIFALRIHVFNILFSNENPLRINIQTVSKCIFCECDIFCFAFMSSIYYFQIDNITFPIFILNSIPNVFCVNADLLPCACYRQYSNFI